MLEMEEMVGVVGGMRPMEKEEVMAVVELEAVVATTDRTLHCLSELSWWQELGELETLQMEEVEEESS